MARSSDGTYTNYLQNTAHYLLAGARGPFTVGGWIKSGNTGQTSKCINLNNSASGSWQILYGHLSAGQITFYSYLGANPTNPETKILA